VTGDSADIVQDLPEERGHVPANLIAS